MTFKLIDAEIRLAQEHADVLKFQVRDCKSQQELENIRVELQRTMDRIDDLSAKKARSLADSFAEKLKANAAEI